MKTKKVNIDYLKLFVEVYFLIKINFLKFKKNKNGSKAILIVNPCLIGEFAASLFAIKSFVEDAKAPVDIVVSANQKSIAEKIIGIRNVYTVNSHREWKSGNNPEEKETNFDKYKKVIVLRANKEAYNIVKRINTQEIKTSLKYFIFYGLHLYKSLIIRKTPKQWREMNFEILNVKKRDWEFDDIFKFEEKDFEKITQLKEIKTEQKIILLHVSSGWQMKNWKIENWIELLRKIKKDYPDYKFIFVGGRDNISAFEKIQSNLNFQIYSFIDKTNLKELLLIMRRSDYFIGVDSGPSNFAHLCDLRSVTILGPGPHMYLPYSNKDIAIDKSNGRGLYQLFFNKKRRFVDKISADEVFSAFKRLTIPSDHFIDSSKRFFSIIVPAHNEEKIIKETLTYLKNLSYPSSMYEVIVVENGSTDKTYEIAKSFECKNFKVFHLEKSGVSVARNFGIKKVSVKSQWAIFLDADTFLKSNFLNKLNRYLDKHPQVTYGTTYITPFPSSIKHKIWHLWVNYGDLLAKYLHRIHIVKKEHLFKVKYDESISSTEDLRFSRDLAKDQGKYFFLFTKDVLNSTRRWDSEGYIKSYLLSSYHVFLGIVNKKKLKKQKWKVIR